MTGPADDTLRARIDALADEVIAAGTPYPPGTFADGIRCGAIETARRFKALLTPSTLAALAVEPPETGTAEECGGYIGHGEHCTKPLGHREPCWEREPGDFKDEPHAYFGNVCSGFGAPTICMICHRDMFDPIHRDTEPAR